MDDAIHVGEVSHSAGVNAPVDVTVDSQGVWYRDDRAVGQWDEDVVEGGVRAVLADEVETVALTCGVVVEAAVLPEDHRLGRSSGATASTPDVDSMHDAILWVVARG